MSMNSIATRPASPRLNASFEHVEPNVQGASSTSTRSGTPSNTVAVAPPPATLRQLMADQQNMRGLAGQLRGVETWVEHKISSLLNNTTLVPQIDSRYASKPATSLATVITELGYEVPRTAEQVTALVQSLEHKASLPILGNLGGGLRWPIPMSQDDRQKILNFLRSADTGLPDYPSTERGMRSYLLAGASITQMDLQDPVKALKKILDSPRGKALGQAVQKHLGGMSTDMSQFDYALATINLVIDPSLVTGRKRNSVALYDLAQPENCGQSPSTVIERLSQHMITTGRAVAETAKFAASLLLASAAPQYLIKDIPKNVTIGSQAWAKLSIAAAAIEAERPGAVPNMTFAEVMIEYENTGTPSQATRNVQTNAVVDWAVANGIIKPSTADTYSLEQIDTARIAFNQQHDDRLHATQALDKELPSRKDLALAKLRERFGDLGALFEEKVLGTDQYSGEPEQVGLVGLHSLLDIAMMDMPNLRPFVSSDSRIPLEALNANRSFGLDFDQQFNDAVSEKKAAVNLAVRHMISQLPLEDRQNLEFGKVTFFQEGSYELGLDFFSVTSGPNKPQLLVHTERQGKSQAYEINFNKGTIERTGLARAKNQESRKSRFVDATKEFRPKKNASEAQRDDLVREHPVDDSLLNSFNSSRSISIADAFVEHLELDDPAIKEHARGQTTLDELQGGPKPLSEFLLNLIPFRSAIINIQNGNYGAATADLTLDIFSFLTAGVAVAGKLIKIGSSALSAGTKALKATRVIGAATIGVLNPVSGLGDVAIGGIKLLGSGSRFLLSKATDAVNMLKGASGSYDLLKTASKSQGVVATGTYKVAEHTYEAGAVLDNGKWYAYDPVNGRAYGSPLPMFSAKSVAMGGEIQNFRVLNHGLGMSVDVTKRGLRLTLDAHGAIPPGAQSALMKVNGDSIGPGELLDQLKQSNVDLSQYQEIRLTMCNSGTGGERSFAALFAKLTHKPTEAYVGVMYTSSEVEDVAARMFKNGGAKQREFIEDTIIGQKKHIEKYKLTGMTDDDRGLYTPHPDYNPVSFDAEGKALAPKPLRSPYAADKVDLHERGGAQPSVDFSEYEDLT